MNFNKLIVILLLITSLSAHEKVNITMDINDSWDKLIKYWKSQNVLSTVKCQGANITEIERVKNYYGDIPDSLLKSLAFCNNFERALGITSSNWGSLYNIDDMLETSKNFSTFKQENIGYYKEVLGNIKNPKMAMPKEWIPIYDWNSDYIVVVDMLSKNKGQVIVFCLEFGTVAKWTDSYEEWFALAVDEVLKYGELRVGTIESILQMSEE